MPLTSLTGIVNDPAGVDPGVIGLMCRHIAGWAQERGHQATAVGFAQAAAVAMPEDASAAYTVGSLALAWGRLPRADSWLRRAIGIARRSKDLKSYARARLDLGTVCVLRGTPREARKQFVQAVRAARRGGAGHERGLALHGLARLARDTGKLEDAERLARAAARLIDRTLHRGAAARLLLDLGDILFARHRYTDAERALEFAAANLPGTADRVRAMALLARTATHSGSSHLHETAWTQAWVLATDTPEPNHTEALLNLGVAAANRSAWLRVHQVIGALPSVLVDREQERVLEELTGRLTRGV